MPGDDITVREITPEDVPFAKAMLWEAIMSSPSLVGLLGVEELQRREDFYWSRWGEYRDRAYVAVNSGGRRLGAIIVRPNDTDEPVSGWRIGIGVAEDARGQGVGRALMEHVIRFARGVGARYMSLQVDPSNSRAIALYEHVGFMRTGEHDGLLEMRREFDINPPGKE